MLENKMVPKNIIAVDVYLESRKTRTYVGRLVEKKEANQHGFVFQYDERYLYNKSALPLGPDLPITKKVHTSAFLFKTLNDRIPSSKNPAYEDYCKAMDISPKERNPIILLATIGRRGPSSFVFEPVYADAYSSEDLKKFRKNLGLTMREFASVFDFTPATIQRIETGKVTGKDALKRIAIYDHFPEVAIQEIVKKGGALQDSRREAALTYLKSRQKESKVENQKPSEDSKETGKNKSVSA